MIVIIAGMPRSGSTFSFNIVRELLQQCGTVAWASANDLPPDDVLSRTSHFILKTHSPSEAVLQKMAIGAVRSISTVRKPEEAVASWRAVFAFDLPGSIAVVRDWLQWRTSFTGPLHEIAYELIEGSPSKVIADLQLYLLGCEDDVRALELLRVHCKAATFRRVHDMLPGERTVDIGFSYYDAETFLHRRHLRSPDAEASPASLTDEEAVLVRTALAPFVDLHGMYCPPPAELPTHYPRGVDPTA